MLRYGRKQACCLTMLVSMSELDAPGLRSLLPPVQDGLAETSNACGLVTFMAKPVFGQVFGSAAVATAHYWPDGPTTHYMSRHSLQQPPGQPCRLLPDAPRLQVSAAQLMDIVDSDRGISVMPRTCTRCWRYKVVLGPMASCMYCCTARPTIRSCCGAPNRAPTFRAASVYTCLALWAALQTMSRLCLGRKQSHTIRRVAATRVDKTLAHAS